MSTNPPIAVRTPRATPKYFFTGSSRPAADPLLSLAQLLVRPRELAKQPRIGGIVPPYDRDPDLREQGAGIRQRGRDVLVGGGVGGHRLLGAELAGDLPGV